jgi:hypothetical protein
MLGLIFAHLLLNGAAGALAHNCKCRAAGHNYSQGQILCIRGQLARCEMNQNIPTWKIIAQTCPEARSPPQPSGPQISLRQ